jgi:predicted sugar kinase
MPMKAILETQFCLIRRSRCASAGVGLVSGVGVAAVSQYAGLVIDTGSMLYWSTKLR